MKALTIAATAILFAVAMLPHSTRAQQSSAAGTGTVQGTVTKAELGDPLAGARITLAGGPAGAQAMQNLMNFAASQGIMIPKLPPDTSDEQIMRAMVEGANALGMTIGPADIQSALDKIGGAKFPTTVTDSSGRFSFAGVPAGRYTIRVEHNGYYATSTNGPNLMALVDAVVTSGKSTELSLSMRPTGIISGRVRDYSGRPMSNVDVQAYRIFYEGGLPLLDPVVSKSTDDLGEFRLIWVLPGEHLVGVTPRPPSAASVAARNPQDVVTFFPETTDTSTAIPISVRSGEEASAINIGVRKVKSFHVSGRVNSSVIPPPGLARSARSFRNHQPAAEQRGDNVHHST